MKCIWYYIRNNGDGSASVVLCSSEEEAIKADDAQTEAWGESSVGFISVDLFSCPEDPGYEIRYRKYTDQGMSWVKAVDYL